MLQQLNKALAAGVDKVKGASKALTAALGLQSAALHRF